MSRRKIGEFLYKRFIRHPAIAKKHIHVLIVSSPFRRLARELIEQADVHCVNSAGINSSLKAGFKHCCTATRFDVKNGDWLDVAWLRKEIGPLVSQSRKSPSKTDTGSQPNVEKIELEKQLQTLQGARV